ncbi:MAG: patatin-like phospholipase family protein [Solirubrobacterales bacterium]|nr:patatin-like phospholipase family protein [Solirubrobacterales bacterium]
MKVGLVLGAGGVLGGAWLVGALQALASETGWDPGSAEYMVGTSAGALIAGLSAAGVPPWFMVAHSAGETVPVANAAAALDETRSGGTEFRLHRGVPAIGPGSWRLALASLARPYRYSPAAILAGWLPQGLISSDPLKRTIRAAAGEGWPAHPNLWIMACDHDTARRVAFGRADAPAASLADAVAASCAIPGFYRPVKIEGRRYIDGGIASTSNLDVIAGLGLDLVICLNPTSSLHRAQSHSLAERAVALLRQASGRMLDRETKCVRESGTEVLVIQPTVQDLDAMGANLMSRERRHRVIEVGVRSVAAHLRKRQVRSRLEGLPAGEPLLVRRPRRIIEPLDFARLSARRRAAGAASKRAA